MLSAYTLHGPDFAQMVQQISLFLKRVKKKKTAFQWPIGYED